MSAEPYAEVIGSLTDAPDPLVALAEVLVERAKAADPEFAELVSVAAVPRKFDDVLLARLTDTTVDDSEFQRVFHLLRALPFVTSRRDGRLRLHNEIRRALLARYELTDEDREKLRALNLRVAELYDAEHERARHLSEQLGLVDDVLRRVSPQRVPAIRAACEDRLIRPLIEAQHHRTVIDPVTTGFDHFETTFQRYESENRLGVLRMQLNAFQSDVARLRPASGDDERDRAFAGLDHWLVYYTARLRLAEGDNDQALAICRQVLDQPELDPRLKAWCLALVSNALIASGHFPDALEAIAAEIAARADSDPDPWNRSLIHLRQADVHELLWDPESQEASLVCALEAARTVAHTAMEISTLHKLAAVLAGRGDLTGAAEHAVQALHTARTLPARPEQQFWECALHFMVVFGDREPRLADLYHAEARALFRGEPVRTLVTETSYVDVLKSAGQFERAHTALDSLDSIVRDLRPDHRSTVDISRANLLDAEGREREAVGRNRQTVREARAQREDVWTVAAALTNAATTEMLLGDLLDDAAEAAAAGRELWSQMGHVRGVALMEAVRAEVHRRRGHYDDADTVLTPQPPPAGSRSWLLWYLVRADLAVDVGQLHESAGHLETILDEQVRIGDLSGAASAAARAVQVNLRAGQLEDAQRNAARLGEMMTTLAGIWSYEYSSDQEQADQHNARAVRQLSADGPRPVDAFRDAVQNLDEAIKLDAANFWYHLNQAYAYVRLGDRKSGLKALGRAQELATTPFAAAISHLDEQFKAWTPDVVG